LGKRKKGFPRCGSWRGNVVIKCGSSPGKKIVEGKSASFPHLGRGHRIGRDDLPEIFSDRRSVLGATGKTEKKKSTVGGKDWELNGGEHGESFLPKDPAEKKELGECREGALFVKG